MDMLSLITDGPTFLCIYSDTISKYANQIKQMYTFLFWKIY